ncbi:hypothetical protein LRZ95_01365 [Candidatus Gracilibacteria bacterium]|nr:hypothetical protein [Candidatus Gracilibacteria bacterium]
MNTRLELLFEKYNVSSKDRYEINQIFGLLPPEKQQNILKNFDIMIFRFKQIHKEIDLERRILIGDLFRDIKGFYNKYGNKIYNL